MNRTRIAGVLTLAAALAPIALAMPAAARPLPLPDPALEQTVLFARPPHALGDWQQNFYVVPGAAYAPAVCWGSDGKRIILPKASAGSVGYQLPGGGAASVTVFQYPTAKAARAAGADLRRVVCPDSPQVTADDGVRYPGDAGSDLSSSTVGGSRYLSAGVVYQQAGLPVVVEQTNTRQVGRVVIQVQVTMPVGRDASATADLVGAAAGNWIDTATRGYLRFSG